MKVTETGWIREARGHRLFQTFVVQNLGWHLLSFGYGMSPQKSVCDTIREGSEMKRFHYESHNLISGSIH